MTQIEFESELRELCCQKGAAIKAIAQMQGEVKEEIAAIDRQIKDLKAKREKLNYERITISLCREKLEADWGQRIRQSFRDNYTTSRELENVSEWALAKELRHRGYSGQLLNPEKESEFMQKLNAKLNGTVEDEEQG